MLSPSGRHRFRWIPQSCLVGLMLSLGGINCGPDPEIEGEDGAPMLLIPAGEFTMGGKLEDFADHPNLAAYDSFEERPAHRVRVTGFYLDKFEVTNGRYGRFLDELRSTGGTSISHPDHPPDLDHGQADLAGQAIGPEFRGNSQPAVGVSWYSAYAYCGWAGKRLPTEAEWEYAARGSGEYRKYPWGNQEPDADGIWRANYLPDQGRSEDGYESTAPIGSYLDGLSPFGVADMAGNASEWVNDWMDFKLYLKRTGIEPDPQGPESGEFRVIKGGSSFTKRHLIRIATRLHAQPQYKHTTTGFRCAKDL